MTWNMHLPNEIRPTCDICSKLSQMVKLYLFTRCRIDIFIVNVEQISLIILTQEVNTCSKSILITLFSWLWIDFFPTECIHCVKCPNTELFLARIFLYSDWIQTRNYSVFRYFSRSDGECDLRRTARNPELTPQWLQIRFSVLSFRVQWTDYQKLWGLIV